MPAHARPARAAAFVPDKNKQNTIKATSISDRAGGLLWLGAFRADRMHDVTSVRTESSEGLLRAHPDLSAEVGQSARTPERRILHARHRGRS